MIRVSLRIVTPALLIVMLAGCGTAMNFVHELNFGCGRGDHGQWPKVYGGVYIDAQMVASIANEFEALNLFTLLFGIIDFVPSLVADTLTLPFTLTR